ncbi:MAG TPA: endonuclease [Bacteroidia bacterium]|nr:endonuclease [Bacteroidia bacterium]
MNIFFSINVFAQTLTVSSSQLNFGNTFENAPDSLQITIYNNMGKTVDVTGIKFYTTYGAPAFSANSSGFSIPDGASNIIWIKFSPLHNIFHNSEMVIENNGLRGYVNVDLLGQGKYSNTYYNLTENLSEETLKTSLHNIMTSNYVNLTYSPARDSMFMVIDNQAVNGQGASQNTIESIYTGTLAVGYIDRSDCQANFSFNTEHTFPQSIFNSVEPMKSDLHHLFPTDDASNNERADNPFGVVTNPTWTQGGSKSNGSIFEPRDQQKGATARAMMYFVLRYANYSSFFTSQETILRTWHKNFALTQVERKRNNDIYGMQNNRNAFVDYPQFIDRITSISSTSVAPVVSSIDLPQDTIIYGYVAQSVNNIFHFVIVNNGNVNVQLSNFTLSHPGMLSFQTGGSNVTLPPGESAGLDINFFTTVPDSIHGWLTFNTDVPGQSFISVPVFANDPVFNYVPELSQADISLFPDPVHDFCMINLPGNFPGRWSISIFDFAGKETKFSGKETNQNTMIINLQNFTPGVYFVKCESKINGNIFYKKLLKY